MSEIDLHTHSTASDGTYSPTELVKAGQETGLKALALTDHDTTKGLPEAVSAGHKFGLEVIPGCELSVEYPQGQMHIVGLWLPTSPKSLGQELDYLRNRRHARNERIIDKLTSLGIDINYEQVKNLAGEATIGRPHIARVLCQKKVVRNIQEAFDQFIGPQGQAYVPKEKFTPQKAIQILKQEKATVILAHPYSLELQTNQLRLELIKLQSIGLDGMEVFYSEHDPKQTSTYLGLCQELGLLISGGSDFHGRVKPNIFLGKGKGNLDLKYELLEKMKDYRTEQGLWIT